VMIDQQANEVQLHLLPSLVGLLTRLELPLQSCNGLPHPQIVELYPLSLRALLPNPVLRFKPMLGPRGLGAEQAIVAIKAFKQRLRHVIRQTGVEGLRKRRLGSVGHADQLSGPRGAVADFGNCFRIHGIKTGIAVSREMQVLQQAIV